MGGPSLASFERGSQRHFSKKKGRGPLPPPPPFLPVLRKLKRIAALAAHRIRFLANQKGGCKKEHKLTAAVSFTSRSRSSVKFISLPAPPTTYLHFPYFVYIHAEKRIPGNEQSRKDEKKRKKDLRGYLAGKTGCLLVALLETKSHKCFFFRGKTRRRRRRSNCCSDFEQVLMVPPPPLLWEKWVPKVSSLLFLDWK